MPASSHDPDDPVVSFEAPAEFTPPSREEIAVIRGRRWICLEMTSSAIDADIHNIVLCSRYAGKLVMFNFNSTREDFLQLEGGPAQGDQHPVDR